MEDRRRLFTENIISKGGKEILYVIMKLRFTVTGGKFYFAG